MRKLVLMIGMVVVLGMTACADKEEQVTTTHNEEAVTTEDKSAQTEVSYEGEYYSFDTDEPNLQIQKNEDGTYSIEIGIFRVTTLDCTGQLTEYGIEFKEKDEDWVVYGKITFEDDIATVTITSPDWIDGITDYKYYKVT